MLSKNDLNQIEKIFDKNMKESLREFFETLILPYFEHNEKDHADMKKGIKDIKEHVIDHEKRLGKLEAITDFKN
jgi:hypothetical protein